MRISTVLYGIGVVFLTIGVVAIVFRRPLGVGFCRLGKAIFKSSPFHAQFINVAAIYDERLAPKRFLFMGIVSLVQAVLMVLIGLLLR